MLVSCGRAIDSIPLLCNAKGKITQNVSGKTEAETVEQVFASLGRMNWQSFVLTRLPLLKLPADILEALRYGRIEYTKAKEIAKFESESERQELLEDVITDSLSLSQIREQLQALKPSLEPPPLAKRMENIYKKAKKHHVWDDPSKRSRLESLLAQIEELISSGGENESQSVGEAIATQNKPQPTAESSQDSLPLASSLNTLESHTGIIEQFPSESSRLPEETAEVPFDLETPSSKSPDESQPDAREEPTKLSRESTDELLNKSLTIANLD